MTVRKIRIALPVLPGMRVDNYLNALSALGADGALDAAPDPAHYDGLVLPGGGDVDPALYGQSDVACRRVDRALDDAQLAAAAAFARAGRPILGICRGHQLLNVLFGGTLIQHLPGAGLHGLEGSSEDLVHPTRTARDSFLQAVYGEAFNTNSSHHQGIDALGKGLEAVQWSEDGVVEAVAHRSLPVWGVQWHPERMAFAHARGDAVDGGRLFDFFLAMCRTN